VVVGLADESARRRFEELFAWMTAPLTWMSLESADMTKHALNAFLATSVAYTNEMANRTGVGAPVLTGVYESNHPHALWAYDRIREFVGGISAPRVALLGLTYKPGTDTLRRAPAVELACLLNREGMTVQAYDPAVRNLPPDLGWVTLV
jgi:UDPglucose 6-dehydrogenase